LLALDQRLDLRLADVFKNGVQKRFLWRLPRLGAAELLDLTSDYFGSVGFEVFEQQICENVVFAYLFYGLYLIAAVLEPFSLCLRLVVIAVSEIVVEVFFELFLQINLGFLAHHLDLARYALVEHALPLHCLC